VANLAITGDDVAVPKEIRGSGEPILEVRVEEDHRDRVVCGGTRRVKMGAGEGVARRLCRPAVGLWSSSRLVGCLRRLWLHLPWRKKTTASWSLQLFFSVDGSSVTFSSRS
jgi:hypothetical protein